MQYLNSSLSAIATFVSDPLCLSAFSWYSEWIFRILIYCVGQIRDYCIWLSITICIIFGTLNVGSEMHWLTWFSQVKNRVVAFCHCGVSLCHKIDENRLKIFGITSVEACQKLYKISWFFENGAVKTVAFFGPPCKISGVVLCCLLWLRIVYDFPVVWLMCCDIVTRNRHVLFRLQLTSTLLKCFVGNLCDCSYML